MSHRSATARVGLLALTAGLALAACQGGEPGSGATSTPISSSTAVDRAHGVLSKGQLEAALPEPSALGSRWRDDPSERLVSIDDPESITPEECRPLELKGPGWEEIEGTMVGRTHDNYASGKDTYLAISAVSFEQPFPTAIFDAAGDAVGRCPRWTLHAGAGAATYTTGAAATPALGDRAWRVRYDVDHPDGAFVIDILRVSIGHTLVSVSNATWSGEPDPQVTERAVRAVLTTLEKP